MNETKELITNIYNLDQQLRKQTAWSVYLILEFNAITTKLLKEIIDKKGLPTPDKVGKEIADKFVLLLSHCNDLAFVKKIVYSKEFLEEPIDRENLAIAIDNLLVKSGRKQRFGSVLRSIEKNGEIITKPMPIENPKNVNKRRAEFGIKTSIEEYIVRGNESFKKIKR